MWNTTVVLLAFIKQNSNSHYVIFHWKKGTSANGKWCYNCLSYNSPVNLMKMNAQIKWCNTMHLCDLIILNFRRVVCDVRMTHLWLTGKCHFTRRLDGVIMVLTLPHCGHSSATWSQRTYSLLLEQNKTQKFRAKKRNKCKRHNRRTVSFMRKCTTITLWKSQTHLHRFTS